MNRFLCGLAALIALLVASGPIVSASLVTLPAPKAASSRGPSEPATGAFLLDQHQAEVRSAPLAPVWLDADQPDAYNLKFKCPEGQDVGQAQINDEICPIVIWDIEDLLSNTILVVNDRNPRLQVFSALHGGKGLHPAVDPNNPGRPSVQPPTERSRFNALHHPHTNFWTDDMGTRWNDEPYYAPEHLVTDTRKVFGEDNAAVMDSWGRYYHAAMYSFRAPNDPATKWGVGAWMHTRTNQQTWGYTDVIMLKPDQPTNRLDSLHMAISWESNRIFVFWRETAGDNATRSPFVQVYYTEIGDGLNWKKIPASDRLGPCRNITNPVVYQHKIYMGCMPAPGYNQPNSTLEYWQMHELDAKLLKFTHLAQTQMPLGEALLALQGPHGHMIMASGGVQAGQPFVRVSYGVRGQAWSGVDNYGSHFSDASPAQGEKKKVAAARITALAYTEKTGMVHLIYQERYALDPTSNPRNIDPDQIRDRSLYKSYGVIRPNHDFKGKFDIDFGNPDACLLALSPQWQGLGDGVFDDLHDSVVVFDDPTNRKERIFVAYGEYGCVRFGEVEEQTGYVGPILAPPPVPPVPLAISAAQPAWEAAAAGLVFGLMLLRLLTAKRKAAATVKA